MHIHTKHHCFMKSGDAKHEHGFNMKPGHRTLIGQARVDLYYWGRWLILKRKKLTCERFAAKAG